MTAEEIRVLRFLRIHPDATAAEISRSCLAGASPGWLERVVSNLDWHGFIIAFHSPQGDLAALQLTERGHQQVASGS